MRLEIAGFLEVSQTTCERTEQRPFSAALSLELLCALVQLNALLLAVALHFAPWGVTSPWCTTDWGWLQLLQRMMIFLNWDSTSFLFTYLSFLVHLGLGLGSEVDQVIDFIVNDTIEALFLANQVFFVDFDLWLTLVRLLVTTLTHLSEALRYEGLLRH